MADAIRISSDVALELLCTKIYEVYEAQTVDARAKLLGFFHLVDDVAKVNVRLVIQENGGMTLTMETPNS